MCKLFIDNEIAIKEYCEKNRLNFNLAKDSPKSFSKEDVYILHYDEEKAKQELAGLILPEPCPILLKIFKTDNGLLFEQTEYTNQYLSLSGEINRKSAVV